MAEMPEKPLMQPAAPPDYVREKRLASRLLDVLIRAGLILAVAMLCYRVFAPFLTLTVWGLILAVTLYPLHRMIAGRMNGRQGIAATLLVLLGITLLVAPTAVLMNSLGDTVQVLTNSLAIRSRISSPACRSTALPQTGPRGRRCAEGPSSIPVLNSIPPWGRCWEPGQCATFRRCQPLASDHLLLAMNAICRCQASQKSDHGLNTAGNLANVGSNLRRTRTCHRESKIME